MWNSVCDVVKQVQRANASGLLNAGYLCFFTDGVRAVLRPLASDRVTKYLFRLFLGTMYGPLLLSFQNNPSLWKTSGQVKVCNNMFERDRKDQGEGSPKQACSCWFARHSRLATVARTHILLGGFLMPYCLSLTLSVSCLVFVIILFFFVAPYGFAVAEFAFS